MSSLPSIHHGTLYAKPCEAARRGELEPKHGTLRAGPKEHGTPLGGLAESPMGSAIAELRSLISSLSSLSSQAQNLPLTPPSASGAPQSPSYRPQATDYSHFVDDSN